MIKSTNRPLSRPDLPVELHQATRAEHAALNRTIIARLPLCLPPHASSPLAYAAGMTVFSHIYTAFEESWNILLEEKNRYKLDHRQRELFQALQTKYISRTRRVAHDLENLKHSLGPDATQFLNALHTKTVHFHTAICDSIHARPHIILAHAWTMYLALFNGGRWIVKQLINSDASYWFDEQDSEAISEKYLSFWFFDDSPRDDQHGETVKIDFKRNFNAAANSLSNTERDDVIAGSKALFQICADMVELLEQEMAQVRVPHCKVQRGGGSATNSTLSTHLLTILPVASVWQSLRAAIGYSSSKHTHAEDTTKA